MYFSEDFNLYYIDTSNLFECVAIYDKLRVNNRFDSEEVYHLCSGVSEDLHFNGRSGSVMSCTEDDTFFYYWLTNDERRSLMKKLKEKIKEKIKGFSLNAATINIGEFKDEIVEVRGTL